MWATSNSFFSFWYKEAGRWSHGIGTRHSFASSVIARRMALQLFHGACGFAATDRLSRSFSVVGMRRTASPFLCLYGNHESAINLFTNGADRRFGEAVD